MEVPATAPASLIVVVHDSEDQLAALSALLRLEGFSTHAVTSRELGSAADAVALLERLRPVAVLFDLGAPPSDKAKLLSLIRSHRTLRFLPFIVTTARRAETDAAAGGVIYAPIDDVDAGLLARCVARVIRRSIVTAA